MFINFSILVDFILYSQQLHCKHSMILTSNSKMTDTRQQTPIRKFQQLDQFSAQNKNSHNQHQPDTNLTNHKVPLFFKGKKACINKISQQKCAVSVYNSDMSDSFTPLANNIIKNNAKLNQLENNQKGMQNPLPVYQTYKTFATQVQQKFITEVVNSNQVKKDKFKINADKKDKNDKKQNTARSPDFFKLISQKRKQISLQKKQKEKVQQIYHAESDNNHEPEQAFKKKKTHHKKTSSLHNRKQSHQGYTQEEIRQSGKSHGNNYQKIDYSNVQQHNVFEYLQKNNQQKNFNTSKGQFKNIFKNSASSRNQQKFIKVFQYPAKQIHEGVSDHNILTLQTIKSNENLNFNGNIKRNINKSIYSVDTKKNDQTSPVKNKKSKIKEQNSESLNLNKFQNKFEKKVRQKEKQDKTRTDRSQKQEAKPMTSSFNEQHYKSSQSLQKKKLKKGEQKQSKAIKIEHIPSFFQKRKKKINPQSITHIEERAQQSQIQQNSISQIEEKYLFIIRNLNNQLLKLKKEVNFKSQLIQRQTQIIQKYEKQISEKDQELSMKNNQIKQIQQFLNFTSLEDQFKNGETTPKRRNSKMSASNNGQNYQRSSSLNHQSYSPGHRLQKINILQLQEYKKKILDLQALSKQLNQKINHRQKKSTDQNDMRQAYQIKPTKDIPVIQIQGQNFGDYQIQISPPVSRRNSDIDDDQ